MPTLMGFFGSHKVSNQNFQHKLAAHICELATGALFRDSLCLSLTNEVMHVGQRGRAAPGLSVQGYSIHSRPYLPTQ